MAKPIERSHHRVSLIGFAIAVCLLSSGADTTLGRDRAAPPKSDSGRSTAESAQATKLETAKPKQATPKQSKDDWFARWVKGIQFTKFRKSAPEVLQTFERVADRAGAATVEIFCNDQRKLLGLIVDENGYILTKASELEGEITCRLPSGEIAPAEIVGVQRRNDLALLRVPAENLPVAKWRRASLPLVGSWVVAPAPGGQVMAAGIVSTSTRWIRGGVLGVFLEPSTRGAKVIAVNPKAGGGRAGLKRGDIIAQVNGKPVADIDDAIHAIGSYLPGEIVRLQIIRGEETLDIDAKLDSVNKSFDNKRAEFQNALGVKKLSERRAGFPAAFEHDLNLNSDQCGGPVVDLNGDVVGINIARSGRVSSLAIPANVARSLVAEMKAGKWAPRVPRTAHATGSPASEHAVSVVDD